MAFYCVGGRDNESSSRQNSVCLKLELLLTRRSAIDCSVFLACFSEINPQHSVETCALLDGAKDIGANKRGAESAPSVFAPNFPCPRLVTRCTQQNEY